MSKLFLVLSIVALILVGVPLMNPTTANADNPKCDQTFFSNNDILFYNPCDTSCSSVSSNVVGTDPNEDYTGTHQIISPAMFSAITANESVYKQAGTEDNIPWQLIAVLHLRETGLKTVNPANGQGLYQDAAKVNGPYPPGPVSSAEFLRQSVWAGNFLKGKSTNASLLSSGDTGAIKDAFFGYNGRAAAYTTQATSLGFTNGYDGSPYVVNKIDAKRDPTVNPTTWGQIKTDGGAISYPANSDYGAYVEYTAIAGIVGSNDCASSAVSGTLNQKIVTIAQQELALWQAGTLKPGHDFEKYTYGTATDWCAYFVSWVLKQAGHPVNTSAKPAWPIVSQFTNQASTIGFTAHKKGDGYKPKAGDFAIYGGGAHINIVVGYDAKGSMLTIGGNQSSNGVPFTQSRVSEETGYGSTATSYIEVK